MQTATFPVTKSILKWVLDVSSGLLNESWIKKIDTWLSSNRNPTFAQIQQLSKRSRLPFGYFFLKQPPKFDLPILHFRTVRNDSIDEPSKELVDTILSMKSRVDWLRHFRITQDVNKIPFVGICKNKNNQSSKQIARLILKYFNLPTKWNYRHNRSSNFNRFNFLRNRISDYGITVMTNSVVGNSNNRPLNIDEFRAFVLIDSYAPLIFINTRDSITARLFSLVHELVHIGYDNQELFNQRFQGSSKLIHKAFEQRINRVVAEILFPKDIFIKSWNRKNDVNNEFKVDRVAHEFGASPYAVSIKAHALSLINNTVINDIKKQTKLNERKREHQRKNRSKNAGGPSYYHVLAYKTDRSLAFDVLNSIKSGQTSYTRGFDLLDVNCIPQFDQLINTLKEDK